MKKDQSFHDHVVYDLLEDTPGITSRPMFGGWSVYKNGVVFGIIADGELYFKADEQDHAKFEKLGSHPFRYSRKDSKSITMSYWLVPEEIMEDRTELPRWVDRAVTVSEDTVGGRLRNRKKRSK